MEDFQMKLSINYSVPPRPLTLLEVAVRAGQPLLSADEANQKVIELTLENIRLQAELEQIKLWDEGVWPCSQMMPQPSFKEIARFLGYLLLVCGWTYFMLALAVTR
jgi:hypothetical protein